MQKRAKKKSKKAEEEASIEKKLQADTIAISKIWLLIGSESQSAIVDLDDCVTPPELKIGSEVVYPQFGSGALVALSNNKKELDDNRFALCKNYNKRTKKAQKSSSELNHVSESTIDTIEIQLNDLMTIEDAYKEAIYKEIRYSVESPIMQFVSKELHDLFYNSSIGNSEKGAKNEEERAETEPQREDGGEQQLDEKEDETGRNSGDEQTAEASENKEKSAEEQPNESKDAVLEQERNSETDLEEQENVEEEEHRKEKEKQETQQGAVKKNKKKWRKL